jgi:diguanylate cyclase (GGDEF)-like protein
MAVVLVTLCSFAVWAGQATRRELAIVASANSLSDAYDAGLWAITSEQSLTREYLITREARIRGSISADDRVFRDSLDSIVAADGPSEQAASRAILAEYEVFVSGTTAAMDAADRGDLVTARAWATDPALERLPEELVGLADAQDDRAQAATAAMERQQGLRVAATVPIFGIGVAMLAVLALIVLAFRRRSDAQAAQYEHDSLHDDLTGLPNRALFRDRGERALKAAERNERTIGVMMLDLDRFKEINDTLGHDQGDGLLQEVAARLQDTLRHSDTVARLGGDEFTILLPDVIGRSGVVAVAKKILVAFQSPFMVGSVELDIEASIGIATYPKHGSDIDELLSRADVAMYLAKKDRSGFVMYSDELATQGPRSLSLLGDLRRAIDAGDLVLHYQPKADMATAAVVGVEALVRWEHSTLGLIPPLDFIPLAERTGLIFPLTEYVLNAALAQCRAWKDDDLELPVAVNISARNLLDSHFPALVERLLLKWRVPAAMLVLELTENSMMTDPDGARECLASLKDLGVGLSIDDFGTGYSSLTYIKDLPVNELKIDRSFTMDLNDHAASRMIVNSIVSLGRNLGLRVVAEGVEDQEAWRQLAMLGCDSAQGYFLARPMPAADVAGWREAWRTGQNVDAMAGPVGAIA